jgi:hypothetical protein
LDDVAVVPSLSFLSLLPIGLHGAAEHEEISHIWARKRRQRTSSYSVGTQLLVQLNLDWLFA